MKEKPYTHHRSEGQKQISISLSEDLIDRATKLARAQHRSRSALVAMLLEKEIEKHSSDAIKSAPIAAERPATYKTGEHP